MRTRDTLLRALRGHLAAIRRATPAACAGDPDALHAWRVAVRRLRALLRALPREPAGAAGPVQRAWGLWSRRLSPARDADVWHDALRDPRLNRELARTPEGRAFLRRQARRRLALKATLRRRLRSDAYRQLLRRTSRLLERGLPARLSDTGAMRLRRSVREAFCGC